jgi:hypothetical protein
MKVVSRFEANLLRILRCFLQRVPLEQALPLIQDRCPQPPCLSRSAVALVQDSLAKGCMLLLARSGGWRRERFLRGDRVSEGRLWERTPPEQLGLVFSGQVLRFLIWITAAKPADHKPRWTVADGELTAADLLLFYRAYSVLRDTGVAPLLRERSPFVGNGLCRLAYPQDFAGGREGDRPLFALWTNGVGACILEALQSELAHKWVQCERAKGRVGSWERMREFGRAQEAVLDTFLPALEAAGRLDLSRFLLQAASVLLTEEATPNAWVGGLREMGQRLADRLDTYRAALAFLRRLEVFRRWERRARGLGFVDEGYGAGQQWKAEWERWNGELLHSRAQTIIRQLDPMQVASGGQA